MWELPFFVRCEQNAIAMQRGLFSIWEQPFLAFWAIEPVVLAMFQLCALKLGPFAHIESARRMRYGPGEPAIRSRCAIIPRSCLPADRIGENPIREQCARCGALARHTMRENACQDAYSEREWGIRGHHKTHVREDDGCRSGVGSGCWNAFHHVRLHTGCGRRKRENPGGMPLLRMRVRRYLREQERKAHQRDGRSR